MEESKFFEAQILKNQITNLNNWIKDTERTNAKICVSWPESKQEYVPEDKLAWRTKIWTENNINTLPENLKDKVIQLVKDEIKILKDKFDKL